MKEETEKFGLKLNIQKTEEYGIWSHCFMANRWGNNGNSDRLYFLSVIKSPQMVIAAMKLKTLAPWKKIMTNLDSILKSRDITLPTKAHLAKAMVFPVVMDGCDSWTIKKAEHQRTDAFECGVGEDA